MAKIGKYGIFDEFSKILQERKCPVCKKKFYTPSNVYEWGYTINAMHRPKAMCSYHCMREFEKPIRKAEASRMCSEFLKAGNIEMSNQLASYGC